MRKDMAKIIVERPRAGGGRDRRGRAPALEDLPKREGIKRPHTDRKELNENLAPLVRFLDKNVGRPWNNVYSEISERINVNSAVQAHIKQHLWDFVEKDVVIVDGKPRKNGHGYLGQGRYAEIYSQFYVHPLHGLLCRNKDRYRKTYRRESKQFHIEIDANRWYKPIKGIWYALTLTPMAKAPPGARDRLFNLSVQLDGREIARKYNRLVYASGKRQLNKKELKGIDADLRAKVESDCAKSEGLK